LSKPIKEFLDEHDLLRFQKAEAERMLVEINKSIEEDQRVLDAHHSARVEIASARAVIDARLTDLEFQIVAAMPEEVGDEQFN
jgi:hypothetical protein